MAKLTPEQAQAILTLERAGQLTDERKAKIRAMLQADTPSNEQVDTSSAPIPQPTGPQKPSLSQLEDAPERPVGALQAGLTGAANTLGSATTEVLKPLVAAATGGDVEERLVGALEERQAAFQAQTEEAREDSPIATAIGEAAPIAIPGGVLGAKIVGQSIKAARAGAVGLSKTKAVQKATQEYSKLPDSVKRSMTLKRFLLAVGI